MVHGLEQIERMNNAASRGCDAKSQAIKKAKTVLLEHGPIPHGFRPLGDAETVTEIDTMVCRIAGRQPANFSQGMRVGEAFARNENLIRYERPVPDPDAVFHDPIDSQVGYSCPPGTIIEEQRLSGSMLRSVVVSPSAIRVLDDNQLLAKPGEIYDPRTNPLPYRVVGYDPELLTKKEGSADLRNEVDQLRGSLDKVVRALADAGYQADEYGGRHAAEFIVTLIEERDVLRQRVEHLGIDIAQRSQTVAVLQRELEELKTEPDIRLVDNPDGTATAVNVGAPVLKRGGASSEASEQSPSSDGVVGEPCEVSPTQSSNGDPAEHIASVDDRWYLSSDSRHLTHFPSGTGFDLKNGMRFSNGVEHECEKTDSRIDRKAVDDLITRDVRESVESGQPVEPAEECEEASDGVSHWNEPIGRGASYPVKIGTLIEIAVGDEIIAAKVDASTPLSEFGTNAIVDWDKEHASIVEGYALNPWRVARNQDQCESEGSERFAPLDFDSFGYVHDRRIRIGEAIYRATRYTGKGIGLHGIAGVMTWKELVKVAKWYDPGTAHHDRPVGALEVSP